MDTLSRLGNYMSTRRGFLRASMIGLGVPAAAIGAWIFNDYGYGASLFVVPCAFVAAYLWGIIMWRLVFRDLYAAKLARRKLPD